MDKYDLDIEEKNLVGGLDRLLVNFGMAVIAVLPTYFYLIFKPKALSSMLLGKEPDGRQGLKLGPGATFVFSILFILAVGYFFRDAITPEVDTDTVEPARKSLRAAVSEGNIWRTILLSMPLYLGALYFGVIFHITHRIFRKKSNLTLAVGIGLYGLSTVLFILIPSVAIFDKIAGAGEPHIMVVFPMFACFFIILPWQTYSFSRHAFKNEAGEAAAIALVSTLIMCVSAAGFGVIGSLMN